MGGGGGPTYTSSTSNSIGTNSIVWIVMQPATSTAWPNPGGTSVTLKFYVQSTRPVSTDTPLHTETVSNPEITSYTLFQRTGGTAVIDDLKIECCPLDQVDSTTTWPKKVPVPSTPATGYGDIVESAYFPASRQSGTVYLGTDYVYTSKEDS